MIYILTTEILKIGDEIYIPDIDNHPTINIIGGLGVINFLEYSVVEQNWLFRIKEFDIGPVFRWEIIGLKQKELKKKFGNKKAFYSFF